MFFFDELCNGSVAKSGWSSLLTSGAFMAKPTTPFQQRLHPATQSQCKKVSNHARSKPTSAQFEVPLTLILLLHIGSMRSPFTASRRGRQHAEHTPALDPPEMVARTLAAQADAPSPIFQELRDSAHSAVEARVLDEVGHRDLVADVEGEAVLVGPARMPTL